MNYSKWLLVTLSALAVVACGGDDNNESSGGGNGGGAGKDVVNVTHKYHTLAYTADFTKLTQAYDVSIPHYAQSGTINLGGTDVTFRVDNNQPIFNGYQHLVMGDDFSPEEGGLLLCKGSTPDSSISHAILPALAKPMAGSPEEQLIKLSASAGGRFNAFYTCDPAGLEPETPKDVFVFTPAGLSVEEDGEPDDEGLNAAEVQALLGGSQSRDEEDDNDNIIASVKMSMKAYESDGSPFIVFIEEWDWTEAGKPNSYEMIILAPQPQ